MAFIIKVYFSGEAINVSYLPILVPVGVIGNTLSFLVSFVLIINRLASQIIGISVTLEFDIDETCQELARNYSATCCSKLCM